MRQPLLPSPATADAVELLLEAGEILFRRALAGERIVHGADIFAGGAAVFGAGHGRGPRHRIFEDRFEVLEERQRLEQLDIAIEALPRGVEGALEGAALLLRGAGEVTHEIGRFLGVGGIFGDGKLLAAERQVLELIASDASLQVVLDALCNRVESLISDCFAAVLLLQPDNGHLVLGSAPSLRRTCRDVGQNCPENPAVCACAAAIRTGKQIIAEHIDDSEQWQDCRDFASALGLKTAWSTPIVSPGKEVLGTLSLYFRQGRRPNRFDKDVIEHACRQAAIAIDRNRAMDSLHRLATVDTLTGLNNRSRFLDQGEAEITRARRLGRSVAVLMLDVDHFKRINDTHGHGAGDVALKIVAAIIARELRAIDICGRLGGEEFAVMLPETDGQGAMQAAERLRQAVAQEKVRVAEGVELGITVSIGATILAPQDANIDHLLARADGALYEAKRSGRNLALYAAPGNIPS